MNFTETTWDAHESYNDVCPVCEGNLDGYDDLTFGDQSIEVTYTCPECGSEFTTSYWMDQFTIHKDGRLGKEV